MSLLETFEYSQLEQFLEKDLKRAQEALEKGKIVFLPKFSFPIVEKEKVFFSPNIVSPSSKNVSFHNTKQTLGGVKPEFQSDPCLKEMLKRYNFGSHKILKALFPSYALHGEMGRTSFRPVETEGRVQSKRQDDTLLHVDSFPASPVRGNRILRIFTNVNPEGRPRKWNVGEPFENVAQRFARTIAKPLPLSQHFLKLFKITKSLRTPYDHYMLNMHNKMKEDVEYQESIAKQEILFPSGSTWIVFTDQVSHAALAGQFLFEQTFYIPVHALANESTSPLRVLERLIGKKLT